MNRALPGLRFWLAAAAGLLLCHPGRASAQDRIPEPVVLVLNVLSSTHARPATGLVISDSGQILVPAGFVGRGDEIVVLDGGTSLDRNALPTRTEVRSAETGLAVLSAADLHRPPFFVASAQPRPGAGLTFIAFPPAAELAEGMPPIVETVRAETTDGEPAVSARSPLPNVNGVLLDRCGYLIGVVLANGEPGMQRDARPEVLWQPRLREAMEALGLNLNYRDCGGGPGTQTAPASSRESESAGPQMLDSSSLLPSEPDLAVVSEATAAHDPAGIEADDTPERDVAAAAQSSQVAQPTKSEAAQTPPPGRPEPPAEASRIDTAWVLALVALAALAGWWFGRGSPRAAEGAAAGKDVDRDRSSAPAKAPVKTRESGIGLTLEARFPDGRKQSTHIHLAGDETILLGRGQVDLVLSHPSVSKVHGRLQMTSEGLLYTDTGSDRGSWVDGVSCLEGERFFIGDDTELILGLVHISLLEAAPGGEEA